MSLRTQDCLPTTRPWLVKQSSLFSMTLNSFEHLTSYSYLLVECEALWPADVRNMTKLKHSVSIYRASPLRTLAQLAYFWLTKKRWHCLAVLWRNLLFVFRWHLTTDQLPIPVSASAQAKGGVPGSLRVSLNRAVSIFSHLLHSLIHIEQAAATVSVFQCTSVQTLQIQHQQKIAAT